MEQLPESRHLGSESQYFIRVVALKLTSKCDIDSDIVVKK